MLKRITLLLILITWPISLFVNNTPKDFLHYILFFLDQKFAILPLFFVTIFFFLEKKSLRTAGQALLIFLSLILLLIFLKPFFGQTIFTSDRDSKQQLIQKGNLYNSVFLARLFQNKTRIPIDKFTNNFFAITDPGNYFFGFAPRQITIDNQNLKKFPFLSLPFILIGLYCIKENKHRKIILSFLLAGIINLSLLTNFDRNDFILWIPIFLIISYGLNIFDKRFKYAKYYERILVVFSMIEILRILIK